MATRLAQSVGMASTAGGGRCITLMQPVRARAAMGIKSFFISSTLVLDVWLVVDTAHGFFLFDHETACRGCTVPQHVCAVEVTVLQKIRVSYVQKKFG